MKSNLKLTYRMSDSTPAPPPPPPHAADGAEFLEAPKAPKKNFSSELIGAEGARDKF